METINVTVNSEIYVNDDFHIYAGYLENTMEELSIKTNGFELCNGPKKLIGVMGQYQGKKSFMCKYEDFEIGSKTAQKNLLMSIKGIKEQTADLVVENVDDINIFRTDDYPKIKGIGPAKVMLIREGLQQLDTMQIFKEINMLLGSNTTPAKIKKVTNILETMDNGIEKFKENPYLILIEHAGFGFKAADKISLGMGIKYDNPVRRKYLIEYIVKSYTQTGNCYITREALSEKLNECGIIGDQIECIEKNDRLVVEKEKVYTRSMFEAETKIPFMLNKLINREIPIEKLESYDISNMITDFEKLNNIKFDSVQAEAIHTAVNNNVSAITGGAGSGKTTLLKCVLYILNELSFRCYLTAPTGKAARRMSQATDMTATTVHRFLNEALDSFTRKNAVMVVDEFSMVDAELFYDLLNVMENCPIDFIKIIFVGDPGQLPSVQPGNCLHDLISSKTVPIVKLVKTFRQKGDSNIIDIATKVRYNSDFDFMMKKDFYVREAMAANDYKKLISYFFKYLYDKYENIDAFYSEVQFITPMKKGDIGVNSINEMLKKEINPSTGKKQWFPFDVNDKIMCIKNDRENGVFNGEFGRLTSIENTTFTVFYKDLDKYVTYKKEIDTVQNFQLSYCSTVHKLQGSEFKFIVLVLPQDSIFIDSRLLYTAITRGKSTVIMLTNKAITSKVVARNNLLKRNTWLKQRLQNTIGGK
jgi:exodeoxyribonuclease V alpha subunit